MALDKETRLKLAICLSVAFMIVELVGGYFANSVAIFSDAAHLLTDVAGFGVALMACIAAKSPGSPFLTFGLARAEVFAALASVLSLWVITAVLLYAAFIRAQRWFEGNPEPVNGKLMFIVAIFGVCVNLCLGYLFSEEHVHSLGHDHSHSHSHGGSGRSHAAQADNGHSCGSGGAGHVEGDGHSHGHGGHQQPVNEKTSLLAAANKAQLTAAAGSDHGHSHGHDHAAATKATPSAGYQAVATSSCSGHDHGHGHDHQAASHDHASHSHADHDHSDHADHAAEGHHDEGHDDHAAGPNERSEHERDVNIEAAYLHVLTDLIQSLGVALAGFILYLAPTYQILDPICTFLFSLVALWATIPLIQRAFHILLEGTPAHLDWSSIHAALTKIDGVDNVHDLHIWSISSNAVSLTCHMRAKRPQDALQAAHRLCRRLGIDHATIQVHDSSTDPRHFCYSQTCDWEHSLEMAEQGESKANGGQGEGKKESNGTRSTLCVTKREMKK